MTDREKACLAVLATRARFDENCLSFAPICDATGLQYKFVRRAVRSLARRGYAQYERGLFNCDGGVAGSGYSATRDGEQFARDNGLLAEQQITE